MKAGSAASALPTNFSTARHADDPGRRANDPGSVRTWLGLTTSDRAILVPVALIRAVGHTAAIFLSQLIWRLDNGDRDAKKYIDTEQGPTCAWTQAEISAETGLSPDQTRTVVDRLERAKLIDVNTWGEANRTWYRPDQTRCSELVSQHRALAGKKSPKPQNPFAENPKTSRRKTRKPDAAEPGNRLAENPPGLTEERARDRSGQIGSDIGDRQTDAGPDAAAAPDPAVVVDISENDVKEEGGLPPLLTADEPDCAAEIAAAMGELFSSADTDDEAGTGIVPPPPDTVKAGRTGRSARPSFAVDEPDSGERRIDQAAITEVAEELFDLGIDPMRQAHRYATEYGPEHCRRVIQQHRRASADAQSRGGKPLGAGMLVKRLRGELRDQPRASTASEKKSGGDPPASSPTVPIQPQERELVTPQSRPVQTTLVDEWPDVLNVLAERVNKPTFETHVKSLVPLTMDKAADCVTVMIGCMTAFNRNWMNDRHRSTVAEAIREVFESRGAEVTVEVVFTLYDSDSERGEQTNAATTDADLPLPG